MLDQITDHAQVAHIGIYLMAHDCFEPGHRRFHSMDRKVRKCLAAQFDNGIVFCHGHFVPGHVPQIFYRPEIFFRHNNPGSAGQGIAEPQVFFPFRSYRQNGNNIQPAFAGSLKYLYPCQAGDKIERKIQTFAQQRKHIRNNTSVLSCTIYKIIRRPCGVGSHLKHSVLRNPGALFGRQCYQGLRCFGLLY